MEKIRIVLLTLSIISFVSCGNKSSNSLAKYNATIKDSSATVVAQKTIDVVHQIIFGIYCAECASNCATMYRFNAMGNQNSFAADYSDSYFTKTEIKFNTYFNDKFHFDIGREIISNIPDTLLNNKNTSERFGCPDCTDGCGIYVEILKENKKQQFYIDNQTNQLTGELKKFAILLKEKIALLEKKKDD